MLTAEPHKISYKNSFIKHRFNLWDHKSMGIKISEILDMQIEDDFEDIFREYSKYCRTNDIEFSVTRIPSESKKTINFLQNNGFYNVETIYEAKNRIKNLQNLYLENIKNKRVAKGCNIEELCCLSSRIFNHGRFTEDYNIGKELGDKRYYNFVKDLYEAEYDRKFLFSKKDLIGFMFYTTEEKQTSLILGGMSQQYSHLARAFWSQIFLEISQENTVRATISGTNIGVMNLYSHFGFKLAKPRFGYHKKWK